MESRDKENALYKHWRNFNPELDIPPRFTIAKMGTFKSATER